MMDGILLTDDGKNVRSFIRTTFSPFLVSGTMRARALLMTLVMFSSAIAGCTSDNTDDTKDQQIAALESELVNMTALLELNDEQVNTLETALIEAQTQLNSANSSIAELAIELDAAQWHRNNLTSQLSDIYLDLNNSNSTNNELQNEIDNLELDIGILDSQIEHLNSEISLKQTEINSLNQLITTLENKINSITNQVIDRISSCPLDNPGMEIVGGFDDGDGELLDEEIEFRVGECPGDTGMIYDIVQGSNWSVPNMITEMGGSLYFFADDEAHGRELWRSDGSVGGTYMVKNIRTNEDTSPEGASFGPFGVGPAQWGSTIEWPNSYSYWRTEMVAGNEKIFFTAFDAWPEYPDLYISDGTEEGTFQISPEWGVNVNEGIHDPVYYSGVNSLYVIPSEGNTPDRVVFSAFLHESWDDVTGEELWISDGTEFGTTMLANIRSEEQEASDGANWYCCHDFSGSKPRHTTGYGDTLYFTANESDHGRELYKFGLKYPNYGLFLIRDINSGSGDSNPSHLTPFSNGLYFVADNGVNGRELMISDGTYFGTSLILDINSGLNSSNPDELTIIGDKMYFTADDGIHGRELWVTDGTSPGTMMVKDINNDSNTSSINSLIEFNGELFFSANDSVHGMELWKSNGSQSGTIMLYDIWQGSNSSEPLCPYWWEWCSNGVYNGFLYFSAADEEHGKELWRTDGTSEGTELVLDIVEGENSSFPYLYGPGGFGIQEPPVLDGRLFFGAGYQDEDRGVELRFYWENPGPIISNASTI